MVTMLGWMIMQIMRFVALPEIEVQLSKFINQRMRWQSFCGMVTLVKDYLKPQTKTREVDS